MCQRLLFFLCVLFVYMQTAINRAFIHRFVLTGHADPTALASSGGSHQLSSTRFLLSWVLIQSIEDSVTRWSRTCGCSHWLIVEGLICFISTDLHFAVRGIFLNRSSSWSIHYVLSTTIFFIIKFIAISLNLETSSKTEATVLKRANIRGKGIDDMRINVILETESFCKSSWIILWSY